VGAVDRWRPGAVAAVKRDHVCVSGRGFAGGAATEPLGPWIGARSPGDVFSCTASAAIRVCQVIIAVVLVAGAAAGCASQQHRLVVQVNRGPVAFDAPLGLTVAGADPHRPVRITTTATDAGNIRWQAGADYTPTARGTVEVRSASASNGDYRGAHDGGPVWSLSSGPRHPLFTLGTDATMTVTFTATQDGAATGSAQQTRWFRGADVRVTSIARAQAGFVGTMYSPARTAASTSAVLALGGSEGGMPVSMPEALASRGHPTLAVAYFGLPVLPKTLARIPLEYFVTALRWLAGQPGVDPKRVVVVGGSRGSEAALLLGIHYPQLVHSVAGLSPSAVANPSVVDLTEPAWTWHGQPVPTVPTAELGQPVPQDGQGIIRVERIRGPVFLLCGDEDLLWPSCSYADAMARRLHGHPYDLVREPGAGHLLDTAVPNLPAASNSVSLAGRELIVGGSVQDDALGRLDAWPKLLRFLTS
jgi:dienelactone hydrolase